MNGVTDNLFLGVSTYRFSDLFIQTYAYLVRAVYKGGKNEINQRYPKNVRDVFPVLFRWPHSPDLCAI
jgi:hypothetical protein